MKDLAPALDIRREHHIRDEQWIARKTAADSLLSSRSDCVGVLPEIRKEPISARVRTFQVNDYLSAHHAGHVTAFMAESEQYGLAAVMQPDSFDRASHGRLRDCDWVIAATSISLVELFASAEREDGRLPIYMPIDYVAQLCESGIKCFVGSFKSTIYWHPVNQRTLLDVDVRILRYIEAGNRIARYLGVKLMASVILLTGRDHGGLRGYVTGILA